MNAAGAFPLLSAMSKQFYDVFHVGFLLWPDFVQD